MIQFLQSLKARIAARNSTTRKQQLTEARVIAFENGVNAERKRIIKKLEKLADEKAANSCFFSSIAVRECIGKIKLTNTTAAQ